MKISELVTEAAKKLKASDIEEYKLEAELFMAETLGISRIDVIIDGSRDIGRTQQSSFESMIKRRMLHEPVAYITGRREFMGLDFSVSESILIPRPDTETLAEAAIECIKKNNLKMLAEVGIGSGCISVSIAKYTGIKCFGTDINEKAVETAEINAAKNGVSGITQFYYGNIFEGLPKVKFDIIVSNPPYIRKKDMDCLMEDVKNYEPDNALCGGEDGLDFYRKISCDGVKLLNNGGFIFYEIGFDQAQEVSDILKGNGFVDIKVIKDLSGLDRVVCGRKGELNV